MAHWFSVGMWQLSGEYVMAQCGEVAAQCGNVMGIGAPIFECCGQMWGCGGSILRCDGKHGELVANVSTSI